MFGLGIGELVVIGLFALLFIGPKKLPELAKGLGKGLREFQKAKDEIVKSVKDPEYPVEPDNTPHLADHTTVDEVSNSEHSNDEDMHEDMHNDEDEQDLHHGAAHHLDEDHHESDDNQEEEYYADHVNETDEKAHEQVSIARGDIDANAKIIEKDSKKINRKS